MSLHQAPLGAAGRQQSKGGARVSRVKVSASASPRHGITAESHHSGHISRILEIVPNSATLAAL